MEVLQSNTADNIYFWIEDKEQGNVNPIYESHGAYEIYIVCNGERRMYLGNVLYKVGTGDALMIPASQKFRGWCFFGNMYRIFGRIHKRAFY